MVGGRMTLWDGVRVPMTLLGGYFGAGKTTIVNHVLADAGAEGRRSPEPPDHVLGPTLVWPDSSMPSSPPPTSLP